MMILMPIFYAVLGFGIGALSAFVYNFAARSIGGVELELENTEAAFQTPPPPPDSWTPNSGV
jgi:hypothetical protein